MFLSRLFSVFCFIPTSALIMSCKKKMGIKYFSLQFKADLLVPSLSISLVQIGCFVLKFNLECGFRESLVCKRDIYNMNSRFIVDLLNYVKYKPHLKRMCNVLRTYRRKGSTTTTKKDPRGVITHLFTTPPPPHGTQVLHFST